MYVGERKLREYFLGEIINSDVIYSNHRIYVSLKGIIDFILAFIGLLLTCPIILLTCLLIKIESKGSAFYTQERVGLNGNVFNIIKLRSMVIDAERNGAQWAAKNDFRVTKVGSFIRKTRIDELPQLLNILKGDMSLIGPRPERPVFSDQFNNEIPGFNNRLAVKPGITGWAQVNGGYDITPKEKLLLDMYYIQNLSMLIDCKILVKTIKVVFTGDGAR
ncbi:sugar transferase [Fictibacillus sp. FJAT-27399]|uniref:sugar transferase n=1 Tax=Fictibacillus sp. FJAT-27399 TaxID=1729689 RepID=UPI000781B490